MSDQDHALHSREHARHLKQIIGSPLTCISTLIVSDRDDESINYALFERLRARLSEQAHSVTGEATREATEETTGDASSIYYSEYITPHIPHSLLDQYLLHTSGDAQQVIYTSRDLALRLVMWTHRLCVVIDPATLRDGFTSLSERLITLARLARVELVICHTLPLSADQRSTLKSTFEKTLGWRETPRLIDLSSELSELIEPLSSRMIPLAFTREDSSEAQDSGWLLINKIYTGYQQYASRNAEGSAGTLITGIIHEGSIRLGDHIEIIGSSRRLESRVLRVEFMSVETAEAHAGQMIGLLLADVLFSELSVGDQLHVIRTPEDRSRALYRSGLELSVSGDIEVGVSLLGRGDALGDTLNHAHEYTTRDRAFGVILSQILTAEDLSSLNRAQGLRFLWRLSALCDASEDMARLNTLAELRGVEGWREVSELWPNITLPTSSDQRDRSPFEAIARAPELLKMIIAPVESDHVEEAEVTRAYALRRLLCSGDDDNMNSAVDLILSLCAQHQRSQHQTSDSIPNSISLEALRDTLSGLILEGDPERGLAGRLLKRLLRCSGDDCHLAHTVYVSLASLLRGSPERLTISEPHWVSARVNTPLVYRGVLDLELKLPFASWAEGLFGEARSLPDASTDLYTSELTVKHLKLGSFRFAQLEELELLDMILERAPELKSLELTMYELSEFYIDPHREEFSRLITHLAERGVQLALHIKQLYPGNIELLSELEQIMKLTQLTLREPINHPLWLALTQAPKIMALLRDPGERYARGVSFGEQLYESLKEYNRHLSPSRLQDLLEELLHKIAPGFDAGEDHERGCAVVLREVLAGGDPVRLQFSSRQRRPLSSITNNALYAALLKVSGAWSKLTELRLPLNPYLEQLKLYQDLRHIKRLTVTRSRVLTHLGSLEGCQHLTVELLERVEDLASLSDLPQPLDLFIRELNGAQLLELSAHPRLLSALESGTAHLIADPDRQSASRVTLEGSQLAPELHARLLALGEKIHERHLAGDVKTSRSFGVDFQFVYCSPDILDTGGTRPQSALITSSTTPLLSTTSLNDQALELISSHPLLVSQTPITQAQWSAVMGDNPSGFLGETRPVERVSWFDCVAFCNALSVAEGLKPVYRVDYRGRVLGINHEHSGYRLLTEVEFKHVARAGCEHIYSGSDQADQVAWYRETNQRISMTYLSSDQEFGTRPVGAKRPNAWNLFDLSGNVSEWCDHHQSSLSMSFTSALSPDSEDPGQFMVRGGSWASVMSECAINAHEYCTANHYHDALGFRVTRRLS